jgi:hypothetical protein
MTQVLTVVMVSHMCLSLKDSKPLAQEEDESYDLTISSLPGRVKVDHQTSESLGPWVVGQHSIASVVGTLGNDLEHTSMLDY